MATPRKQITIHFDGEHAQVLDFFKGEAKKNFRSVEQEILYALWRTKGDKTVTQEVKNTTVEQQELPAEVPSGAGDGIPEGGGPIL